MALILLLAACATPRGGGEMRVTATPVALSADPATVATGRLRYRGGLVLASGDIRFGGYSGLRVRPDGWALTISDTGAWAGFRLVESGSRLTGIASFHTALLLDAEGNPPASKDAADAEAVELAADGTATVACEQDHRYLIYPGIDPARPASFAARPSHVVRPAFMAHWPKNGGAEAYTSIGDGDLVISEEAVTAPDVHEAVATFDGQAIPFGYRAPAGYRPTDAVRLDDRHILVLHRHFTPADGVSAIVSMLDFSAIKPGATVEGREVARLAPPLTVDNMEGIAVRHDGARTFVYLISDDNQSKAQRTLLLKFELMP